MDKRKQILEMALKLFNENGFQGTPTSAIAKEAGVATGTLFYHFKTKEELVISLYVDIKQEINKLFDEAVGESTDLEYIFKKALEITINWAVLNQEKFYYCQQVYFSPHIAQVPQEVIEEQTKKYMELLQLAMDTKIIHPISLELINNLLNSNIYVVSQYLSKNDISDNAKAEIINRMVDMLWKFLEYKPISNK